MSQQSNAIATSPRAKRGAPMYKPTSYLAHQVVRDVVGSDEVAALGYDGGGIPAGKDSPRSPSANAATEGVWPYGRFGCRHVVELGGFWGTWRHSRHLANGGVSSDWRRLMHRMKSYLAGSCSERW